MKEEKLFRETILRVLVVGMVNISINKICETHLAFLLRGNWKTDSLKLYWFPNCKGIDSQNKLSIIGSTIACML